MSPTLTHETLDRVKDCVYDKTFVTDSYSDYDCKEKQSKKTLLSHNCHNKNKRTDNIILYLFEMKLNLCTIIDKLWLKSL